MCPKSKYFLLWFPCFSSLLFSCQLCVARWVSHTASSRARLDWADWCTERRALQLPSHRQTRKFVLKLSSVVWLKHIFLETY